MSIVFLLLVCRSRDGPKLLHQAQIVSVGPGFHELAVCKAKDVDRGLADVLASRRKTEKASLVRTTMGEPDHDLVSFGDQVLNRVVVIREGAAQHGHGGLQPCGPS